MALNTEEEKQFRDLLARMNVVVAPEKQQIIPMWFWALLGFLLVTWFQC